MNITWISTENKNKTYGKNLIESLSVVTAFTNLKFRPTIAVPATGCAF